LQRPQTSDHVCAVLGNRIIDHGGRPRSRVARS
jgi:hypothetical protein